ncbi:transglycosylase family protein [Streptomyces sp. NPDC003077]|uniref:transglycosylase family protein n=1 Tax=Streptomyces sp. NPDC003077 TaxID=3154443 RepID=UPI0033AC29E1
MPLFGAAGAAHAADTATWDRVAQCESGGVWSANQGNGYYGGLQLSQDLWERHGGTAYASRPDLASRSQQIAVAQAILDAQGPGAWQNCATDAGLAKGGKAPSVDPGGTATPAPAPTHSAPATPAPTHGSTPSGTASPDESGKSDKSGTGSGAGRRAPTDTRTPGHTPSPDAGIPARDGTRGTADPSHPSGTASPDGATGSSASGSSATDPSTADPSATSPETAPPSGAATPGAPTAPDAADAPAQGRHRGPQDPAEAGGADADRSAGRHASRGGGARPEAPVADDYTVRPGDNLSVIAEHKEVPGGWPALYKANERVIGDDPDLIHPGQRLVLDH